MWFGFVLILTISEIGGGEENRKGLYFSDFLFLCVDIITDP